MTEIISKVEQWSEDRGFFEKESGVTFEAQFLKLYEEFGELCGSIVKGKDVKDDIGDNLVVLINLARINGFSLADILPENRAKLSSVIDPIESPISSTINVAIARYPLLYHVGNDIAFIEAYKSLESISESLGVDIKECLEIAYDEIKDRKGKMINGAFIKEGDL